jgi:proteasome lid subunit RPN8/RPN11
MEPGADIAVATWTAPECPFRIEYSSRVLDDIRLAVVDAFFSLPRGGAEIGGILLGQREGNLISITGFQSLDCEHAMGPSFTLSPRDQTRLAEMTARAKRNPSDRQPVGWYHSHTRSEIFLSETDQDIHKRFFPEPWQLALVLKPHTFEPTRGGFFFREADGSIRGAASYQEFTLDPLPMRPVPAPGPSPSPAPRPLRQDPTSRGTVITMFPESPVPPESPAAPSAEKPKGRVPITREIPIESALADSAEDQEPAAGSGGLDAPQFAQQDRSWRAVKVVAGLAVIVALGGVGYQTREYWLPQVMAKVRPLMPKEPDAYLALSTADDNGQLKIQWDRNAPAVRNAVEAVLEITDGNPIPRSIRLDAVHLAAGAFTYSRESERVDVALTASEPNGQTVREVASFLGKLPGQRIRAEDPEVRRERDAQAQRAEKLQKDLNFQASKTRKLEKDLKDVREQLQEEQKRRLAVQSPDTAKQDQD